MSAADPGGGITRIPAAGSADCGSWECQLGVPIVPHKTEGPGEVLVFLGIEC